MFMNSFKYSLLFCLLLFVGTQSIHAQDAAQTDSLLVGEKLNLPDSTVSQIDSLFRDRLAKLDSLAKRLENKLSGAESDTSGSALSEEEKALAELEEVISWRKVLTVIFFFILIYYLTVFIGKIVDNLSEKISKYRLRIKRLVPITRVLIWSFAIYFAIAGIINPPYTTVITVMASVGIAIGLASQDVLKNLFGGIMLILDKPFQVGDKVEMGEHYGEVLQIGLRSSRIVTPDDSIVTIPNGELVRTSVSNANSGALDCMVISEIFLPSDAPIEKVKDIAYKAVISSRYVYLQKPISILAVNEIHRIGSVIKLKVKAYVLDIRFEFPFQSDVTELILQELSKEGISFIKTEKIKAEA